MLLQNLRVMLLNWGNRDSRLMLWLLNGLDAVCQQPESVRHMTCSLLLHFPP